MITTLSSCQDAFKREKQEVLKWVSGGIQSFDLNRTTCLQTDFSKEGTGFLLLQKYCSCPSLSPRCWKLCYVSSRFLSPAETRYSTVEGDMLSVAWGLRKTHDWVQGCPS